MTDIPCEYRKCHKPTNRRIVDVKRIYCSPHCAALDLMLTETGFSWKLSEAFGS